MTGRSVRPDGLQKAPILDRDAIRSRTPLTGPGTPRLERGTGYAGALRGLRSADSPINKGGDAYRGPARGNWYGGRTATGLDRVRPIDLSFSNVGRDGYVRGGLSIGRDGIRAYYDRHRFRDRYYGHHHHRGPYWGFSYYGEYFGGHYYPYGYASSYDVYYHRFPYRYVTVDYVPTWTVYVDTPVVDTVYVERPSRTVYIEEDVNGVDVVYPSTVQAPPDEPSDFVGPPAPPNGDAGQPDDAGGAIQVEPQERIPINNAWLAGGEAEFREGKYEAARRSFSYAVLEEPRNGFASLAYGLVHFALGDYAAAADALRRGLSLAPDVMDRPIDITRQYGQPSDLATHVQAAQLYLSAHPEDASGWFVLGYVEYSSGHAEEAARAFDKAASLNPDDPYAAVLRDAARRVTGDR